MDRLRLVIAAASGLLLAGACVSKTSSPARASEGGSGAALETANQITSRIDAMIARQGLDGAAVIIRKDGNTLYERGFGDYDVDTRVQIASATKWVTAALVMTVVERDGLSLDAPLSDYLPDAPADKAKLTLRQMLSHTSGLPADHALAIPTDIEMADAAAGLLELELATAPGTEVLYGGVSLQIAGAVAAKQANEGWQHLFRERIAGRLGWGEVTWDHPLSAPVRTDPNNPNLGAGLHLSAVDYIGFLEMLDQGGLSGDQRILSETSIMAMSLDNTDGLNKSNLPPAADPSWGYGLGCWCEVIDDNGVCLVMHSAGAFGTLPWIDQTTGVYGVIVVKSRLPQVFQDLQAVRRLANALQ